MYIYEFLYVFRCIYSYCSHSCTYGLEDKRGDDAYKHKGSFVKKRGCQCHFIVKFLNHSPHIAILIYNTYEHEYEDAWPCHDQHDTSGKDRALYCQKISWDIVGYVESCFIWQ